MNISLLPENQKDWKNPILRYYSVSISKILSSLMFPTSFYNCRNFIPNHLVPYSFQLSFLFLFSFLILLLIPTQYLLWAPQHFSSYLFYLSEGKDYFLRQQLYISTAYPSPRYETFLVGISLGRKTWWLSLLYTGKIQLLGAALGTSTLKGSLIYSSVLLLITADEVWNLQNKIMCWTKYSGLI